MTPCPVGARGCASRRLASRRHFRCAPIPLAPRATASLRSRCAQAVVRAATAAAPPAPRPCNAFLPRTATHRAHAACAVARYPPHCPALPPPRAVAAFPTPPRCPHIGRRSRPYRPRIFYLPRRGGRPTRRGALASVPTTRHRRAPSIPIVTPPHRLPMPPCRPLRFARPVDCRSLAASRVETPTPSPTSARAAPAHRRCR